MSTLTLSHDQITRLFQDHREALTQFLVYKIRCPETAQDLCQETYLRLLRDNALTHDENLGGFLFRVADRLAINYLKWQRLARNNGVPLHDELICPKHLPDEITSLRQQCEILLDAINSLPRKFRDVFLLRKIDELTYTEISLRLGISEKTVQRHLVEAMLHCHRCMGNPENQVPKAAEALKSTLAAYPGVYDVIDSTEPGQPEVRLTLKPEAERLGVRLEELSEQVRHAYFGDEVGRLQRGRNEVKEMVCYPREERESLDHLAAMPVKLPDGQQAPLGTLAEVTLTPGVDKLIRQNRRRVLKVQARVDPQKADINALYAALEASDLVSLRQRYPGLSIDIGQEHQDQKAMAEALKRNTLIAMLVIYVLIAVPFRSYLKPLIFLLAVPVAWSGAVIAHGLAGLPLSMESLVGMIAASGVVVNDSLVLLDYL